MNALLAVRLINVLGALLLFTMLLILAAGQLYRAIYAVAAQAVLLGIAGFVLAAATGIESTDGEKKTGEREQGQEQNGVAQVRRPGPGP